MPDQTMPLAKPVDRVTVRIRIPYAGAPPVGTVLTNWPLTLANQTALELGLVEEIREV